LPTPADLDSLDLLYREAAAKTAAGSKSFYFATRFFPPELARSAHAVYWFCRTIDDMVDEAPSASKGRKDLDEWEAAVRAVYNGGEPVNPVLKAFFDVVYRYRIPADHPLELIEGVRMDLNRVRYRTFADLRVYCYRVASTVGLMMSKVIGFREADWAEAGLPRAVDLGIAMQLTNILRDVGFDLRLNRVYLPTDEMAQYRYTEADLRAHRINDNFRRLLDFQIRRARLMYAQAEPGIALLDPKGSFAVQVASDVYRKILTVIEQNEYDVFNRRAVVPAVQKYWMTARTIAVPAARHSVSAMFHKLSFWKP
jgi:phytoene synthase